MCCSNTPSMKHILPSEFEGPHSLREEEATLITVVGVSAVRWDALHHQHRRTHNACLVSKWEEQLLWREASVIETRKKSSSGETVGSCFGVKAGAPPPGWAMRVFLRHINPATRSSPPSWRTRRQSCGCGVLCVVCGSARACLCVRWICSWSQSSGRSWNRVPALCSPFQLYVSQSHCRATVPPIGRIAATPRSVRTLVVHARGHAPLGTTEIHQIAGISAQPVNQQPPPVG